jgi:hypothetical protein
MTRFTGALGFVRDHMKGALSAIRIAIYDI